MKTKEDLTDKFIYSGKKRNTLPDAYFVFNRRKKYSNAEGEENVVNPIIITPKSDPISSTNSLPKVLAVGLGASALLALVHYQTKFKVKPILAVAVIGIAMFGTSYYLGNKKTIIS